jgi:hypothetical protein
MSDDFDFLTFEDDEPQAKLPGVDSLIVEDEEEENEERESDWENDSDHSKFIPYIKARVKAIPKHSGTTSVGWERAIAYLRKLDKEISRAIQSDETNAVDDAEAEDIRDAILVDISKCESALEKINGKKRRRKEASVKIGGNIYSRINALGDSEHYVRAELEDEEVLLKLNVIEPSDESVQAYMEWERGALTKEASSAKIVLMADPFLHEVTNIIIRAHVTYGRNIEDAYQQMAKKYAFSPRDHLAVHSLLREKGLLIDRDFSTIGDDLTMENMPIGMKVYPA